MLRRWLLSVLIEMYSSAAISWFRVRPREVGKDRQLALGERFDELALRRGAIVEGGRTSVQECVEELGRRSWAVMEEVEGCGHLEERPPQLLGLGERDRVGDRRFRPAPDGPRPRGRLPLAKTARPTRGGCLDAQSRCRERSGPSRHQERPERHRRGLPTRVSHRIRRPVPARQTRFRCGRGAAPRTPDLPPRAPVPRRRSTRVRATRPGRSSGLR